MRTTCFLALFVLPTITSFAQVASVTVSGTVRGRSDKSALPYVNIVLKTAKDSAFVAGTVTNEEGRFSLAGIAPGSGKATSRALGWMRFQKVSRLSALWIRKSVRCNW